MRLLRRTLRTNWSHAPRLVVNIDSHPFSAKRGCISPFQFQLWSLRFIGRRTWKDKWIGRVSGEWVSSVSKFEVQRARNVNQDDDSITSHPTHQNHDHDSRTG